MQSDSRTLAATFPFVTQFRCCDCRRDFKDDTALTDHLRSNKVHRPKKTEGNKNGTKEKQKGKKPTKNEKGSLGFECKKCKKTFQNPVALRQHSTSVRHIPISNIHCLADKDCKKHFNCPSAQLHHLESGACMSGITRAKLNTAVAVNDPRGIITTTRNVMAQRSLENTPSETSTSPSQTKSPILTPTSTEFFDTYPPTVIGTPISTLAVSKNLHSVLTLKLCIAAGSQKCPLCPPSRTRKFEPSALRQHLSSNIHAQITEHVPSPMLSEISFHCPRLLSEGKSKKAVKQFSTVSGLAQHLESGACAGGKETFRRVINYVQEEMKGIGLGELKLLK